MSVQGGMTYTRSVGAILRLLLVAGSFWAPSSAYADEVADFYRGKRITLYVGSSPGDATDLYGRVVGGFMSKHIPGNPLIVLQNMPGANGLVSANYLYNVALKDGTTLGTFSRYAVNETLWKNKAALFQPEKFNWIGNVHTDVSTCVVWHTTGVAGLSDFMTRDLKIGVTSESHVNILNRVFSAKLRAIKGYKGGAEIVLAMERGEVDGRCNWSWSAIMATRPDWVRDKKINAIIQFAHKKLPELSDVPLISELATTDRQREIIDLILMSQELSHVIVAPPDVPTERIAALRLAFDKTMSDPEFMAAAASRDIPVGPTSGSEVQKLVTQMVGTPPDVVQTFYEAVGSEF